MAKPYTAIRRKLKDFARTIIRGHEHSDLRSYLIQGTSWSFVLKFISQGLAFATSIFLARSLGVEGYGLYAFIMGMVGLLRIPASLGLPQLVMRNVATYLARSDWGLLRGLLTRANQAVLFVSVSLVSVGVVLARFVLDVGTPGMLTAFGVALLLIPLGALNNLRSATLRGLHHIIVGQLPEFLIRPLAFLLLAVVAYAVLGEQFNAPWALGAHVAGTAIALVVGIVLLLRRLPHGVRTIEETYETRAWLRSAVPFLLIGGMQMIIKNTDIVMLGALVGQESAGVYKVATRGAELVTFVLFAANRTLGPTIARLYTIGELERLQKLVTRSARLVLVGSLPIAVGLVVFAPWILLLFGEGFTIGHTALSILSVGQLVNAGMGSVGLILSMAGFERATAVGIGIGAITNVALNAILVPLWQTEGAALATATSLVIWNLILAVQVFRKMDIYPTALGNLLRLSREA